MIGTTRLTHLASLRPVERVVISSCEMYQRAGDIILPETKPETEWVRGRALQKVSPTYRHAKLQGLLFTAISTWARGRGRVGTEWRFLVPPPGEPARPLVPDVAFLDYRALSLEEDEAAQIPRMAPTVAAEILSPDDRPLDTEDKIRVYLAAGTRLVIVVNPKTGTIEAHDGSGVALSHPGRHFTHAAMPGFSLDIAAFFANARI